MVVIKDSLPLDLVQALDVFAIERMPDYTFVAITPPPAWVSHLLSVVDVNEPMTLTTAFPYLERFLTDAEAFWRDGTRRTLLSGPFAASGASEELLLRACALNLGPHSLLVLERLRGHEDVRQILQKARENKLEQERALKQIESLRTPVTTASRLVKALLETDLTSAQRDLIDRISKVLARVDGVTADVLSQKPRA